MFEISSGTGGFAPAGLEGYFLCTPAVCKVANIAVMQSATLIKLTRYHLCDIKLHLGLSFCSTFHLGKTNKLQDLMAAKFLHRK